MSDKKEQNVVTIREFQRNFYGCLEKLDEVTPGGALVVTKNGKPFIKVTNVVTIDDVVTPLPRVEKQKRQVSPPLGTKSSTPPPSVAKEESQKKREVVEKPKNFKTCPHAVIWGLGVCGKCGSNERKYK